MFKAGGDLTEGEDEEGEGLPYKRGD